jgi:hypothetical protein
MLVVLGLSDFSVFAGTETYTLTVADELVRLGHEVVIHAGTAGPIADAARERGVAVITDLERLPASCDAVIVQDTPSAFALAQRFPEARRVMIVHSEYFIVQSPPQLDGVCDAVVVLNDRVQRHVQQLASPPPRVIRLRQPVDLKRFGTRGGAPSAARRALVLGNYLRGEAAAVVTGACAAAGLEPVLSGVHSTPTQTAEQAIADVEVVIGLGRCVVEAMAGRRAAYVYGIAGGDGWVTPERYADMEADGFGGTASELIVDGARLTADLAAWDAEMGPANRQLTHRHHDAAAHAVELVDLLRELQPEERPATDHAGELARLVRLEWQSWSRYAGALSENRELRDALRVHQDTSRRELEQEVGRVRGEAKIEIERLDAELTATRDDRDVYAAEAQRAVADLAAERAASEAFRATARFRLAAALARPLDRLRRSR